MSTAKNVEVSRLKDVDLKTILVIGLDSVALAHSARKAGFKVFAVDFFGDQDLQKTCESTLSIVTQNVGESCGHLETDFSPNKFLVLARGIFARHRVDGIFLASGLEDSPKTLLKLNQLAPIIGNHPRTIENVRGKVGFFNQVRKLGINHPDTTLVETAEEAKQAAKDISYPVLVKPLRSLGGSGIRLAESKTQLDEILQRIAPFPPRILIQEYIIGKHMSVSFVSTGKTSLILTLNEQLLGMKDVGQKEPFGYCGNIVPATFDEAFTKKCANLVQRISTHFNLLGSNGIDLVVPEHGSPYVVEVNPRFQGTLECVEEFLGINLAKAHFDASIKGILPSWKNASSKVCIRLILYARHRSLVPDLSGFSGVRDVPLPGAIVEDGEPLCSVVTTERTRESAMEKSMRLARRVYGIVHAASQ